MVRGRRCARRGMSEDGDGASVAESGAAVWY